MIHGKIVPAVEGHEDIEVSGIDFVSFVTSGTFGKPPILAPNTDNFVAATERQNDVTVLYINPANIVTARLTKTP